MTSRPPVVPSRPNPIETRLAPRRRRLRTAVSLVLALSVGVLSTLALTPVAQAVEAPTAFTNGAGTAPSGNDQVWAGTGATAIGAATTLGSRTYNAADYTPTVATGQPTATPLVNTAGCPTTTGTCANRGTLTVTFDQPVLNPRLHLSGLGGSSRSGTLQTDYNAVLSLAGGGTLTKLSGSNLAVTGSNTITTTGPNASPSCTSTASTTPYAYSAVAGCGSVQVTTPTPVTTLTFNTALRLAANPNATGPVTTASFSADNGDQFNIVATVPQDYGDAPASYQGQDAARHVLSNLRLGQNVTEDNAGAVNGVAPASTSDNDADDALGGPISLSPTATTYSQVVTLSGSSKQSFVSGWIDFDDNGTFEAAERSATVVAAAGAGSATLQWTGITEAVPGATWARFRTGYTRTQVESVNGAADSGEVEDHPVTITAAPTGPTSGGTCAPVNLVNGSFETPTKTNAGFFQYFQEGTAGLQWQTTATDNNIEYWSNGQPAVDNNNGIAITARAGTQWAEINAGAASYLYQDVPTVGGQILKWGVWHRGRGVPGTNGTDSMRVRMGSTASQTAQVPTGAAGATITSGPNTWTFYSGFYTVPAGQTTTRFGFSSVSTSSGDNIVGNFIDDVSLTSEPCVTTTKTVTNTNNARAAGVYLPGDTVQYTVTTTSTGGPATGTVMTDPVPAGITYVPGSLSVGGAARTDAADGDTAAYAAGTGTVTANLGTGATGTAGGTLAAGAPAVVTWRGTINAGVPDGTTLTNTARASYRWAPDATVLNGTPGSVALTTTNVAQPSLTCTNIYAVQGADPRNVWQVAPATGTLSESGSAFGSLPGVADATTINGLGITDGGDRVYGVVTSTANPSLRYIQEINRTAGTEGRVGEITIPTTQLATVLMGSVNPRTGIYYFGGITGSTLYVYGYNTVTGAVLGLVASGPVTVAPTVNGNPGNNGDFAFDNQNNLFLLAAGSTQAVVQSISQTLPTTAVTTPTALSTKVITTITDTTSTNTLAVGLAAGGQGDRRLYVAGPTTLRTVNPSTGAIEANVTYNGAGSGGINDLASCSSPNTIKAQVSFPDGRVAPGDQATTTITGGGISSGNAATTSGTDAGLQDTPAETAGPVLGLDSVSYTVTQTGITSPDYRTTYVCTNLNTGTSLTQGTGRVATFTMPGNAGADATAAYCAFTNTILRPAITLDKQVGTVGGISAGSTVPYTFTVTNTGNVDLSSVSVNDPKIGAVTCPVGVLAVGASRTCTGTYTLTAADVTAGRVVNTATATGVPTVAGLSAPDPTASDSVTLTVPRPPVANPDTRTTLQDVNVTLTPATNDTPGPDNAAVVPGSTRLLDPATNTYGTSVTIANQGTYTVAGSGAVTFDPLPAFVGTATPVVYRVADANGATATSTITITTTAVTPRANPDVRSTPYNTPIPVDVVANDTAGDASAPLVPATVRVFDPATGQYGNEVTVAGQGTYTVTAAGTITFVPLASFSGQASPVTYRVADDNGTTASSTLTVTVGTPPSAVPDSRTTLQDVNLTLNPLANDTASQNGTITPSSLRLLDPATGTYGTAVTIPGQGTFTADAAGAVVFDPLPAFTGPVTTITYRATDSNNAVLQSTIAVTVTPITPTAVPDTRTTPFATAVTIPVAANDTAGDPSAPVVATTVRLLDPATSTYGTSVTVAGQGTYAVNTATGAVTFTPAAGYRGTTTPVTYRVADDNGTTATATITVSVDAPAPPSATADARTTPQGVAVTLLPSANDTAGPTGAAIDASSVRLFNPATGTFVTSLTVAGQGTYAVNTATGAVTFTPVPAFTGAATAVGYRVSDVNGATATSNISITVTPVTPSATDDARTTAYETAVPIDVAANDTPGNAGVPLVPASVRLFDPVTSTFGTSVTVPGQGTYVVDTGTGVVTFTPAAGFTGPTSAETYRITDANGTTTTARITVTVALPPAPSATPDTRTTPQNTDVVVSPLANDTTGAAGVTFRPSTLQLRDPATGTFGGSVSIAGQGTYTVDPATGTVTLDPAPAFTGTGTTLTYRVTDSTGQSATSTITVTVTPVTPSATNDTATTPATTAVTTAVLGNDAPGAAGTPLVPTSVVLTAAGATDAGKRLVVAGEGTYTVGTDGAITFLPAAGFSGTTTPVQYRVSDTNGTTAVATYAVTVGAGPVARPDATTTPQNVTVSVDPVPNDAPGASGTGVAGTLSRTSVVLTDTAATNGGRSLVVSGQGVYTVAPATGVVTFDPEPGFSGRATAVTYRITDSFGSTASSTITVTVTPVTPQAADDSRSTPYDTTVAVPVLANDAAGAESAPLVPSSLRLLDPATGNAVTTVSVAGQGTYTVGGDGTVAFDPAVGFAGLATPVAYRVLDTNGTPATALVRITVGAAPVARPDTRTTPQDVTVVVDVLADDSAGTDGAGATGTLVPGSVVLTAAQATDAGKTLVVAGQGTYTVLTDGTVRFDPLPAFTGTATGVVYAVTDSFGSRTTATVTVTVTPITPTASDDRVSTPNDVTVSVPVLANDVPGAATAPLVPSSVVLTGPQAAAGGKSLVVAGEGTWTVDAAGAISFDPLPAFSGATTPVGYRVSDANGTTATATAGVTVGAGPIARPDTQTTPQNTPTTLPVLTNDTPGTNGAGASGTLDPASVVLTGAGAADAGKTLVVAGQGTFRVTPAGTVTFTPVPGFTGTTATVPYRVTDSLGGSAASTVTVVVTPVTPTVRDDTDRTPTATPVTVGVLGNDSAGSPAAPLQTGSVVLTSPQATDGGKTLVVEGQGTYVVNAAGTITFTPVPAFSGVTTPVGYRVSDANGTTAAATLTVTVGAAPTANPDTASTPQDVTATLNPLTNDTPGTDATLVATSVRFTSAAAADGGRTLVVPGVGTWTANPTTGAITLDPLPAFTGPATATYSVSDTNGTAAVSTATFTVTPITPRALDDVRNTPNDTTLSVDVLGNDSAGAVSAPLRPASVVLTSVEATEAGKSLVVAGEGTYRVDPTTGAISFDPLPAFSGTATPVAYRVLDANGTAATALLRISVGAAAVARPDTASTPQDRTVALSPLGNDSAGTDGAGTTGTLLPGSVVLTSPAASPDGKTLVVGGQGTWTVAPDGTVSFDPVPTFTGTTTPVTYRVTDSFDERATSTLTVTVTPITPVAADDTASTPANTPLTLAVLANDQAGAGTAPLVPGSVLLTSPQATNGGKTLVVAGQGTWQVNADGSVTFSPLAGTSGVTTPPVQYSVADTNGTRATALVSVTVGDGPVARPDTATTPQDVTVSVPTLGTDTPGSGATLLPGSVVLTNPDVTNAGRTLVVAGQGTWTVSASTGAVSLDPVPTFTGQATVTYSVRDTDGNAAVSTVTVTVTPITPTADDDSASTPSVTPVRVVVLENDEPGAAGVALVPGSVVLTSTDAIDSGKTLVVANQGTYTVATDGSITFTPAPGFTGVATPVGYRVLDANGTAATAQLRLTVGAGPFAGPDTRTTPQNVTVVLAPLGNDTPGTDGAGNAGTLVPGSIVLTSPQATDGGKTLVVPGQGTWTVRTDGTVELDPEPAYVGTTTPVAYRVADSFGGTATSTLTVTVTALAPSVNDDTAAGPAGTPLVVEVLLNDRPGAASAGIDETSVVFTSPQATDGGKTLVVPDQGTWTVRADGAVVFTPAPGFAGVTTPPVEYQVSDDNGTTGRGLISATIGAGPVARPNFLSTPQDVTATIDPVPDDDAGTGLTLDRTSVRFASVDATDAGRTLVVPGRGTFTVDPASGEITFDPLPSTTGQVSATYRIADSAGNEAVSTVTFDVTPITPVATDDVATTPTDRTVVVTVLGNDDPGADSAPLVAASVTLVSPVATAGGTSLVVPGQGTYTVTTTGPGAGSISFDPVPGFAGTATPVTYRVADANGTTDTATLTVTVRPAPTAAADARTTPQNTTVAVPVLGNDAAGGGATIVPGTVVLTSPAATEAGKRLEVPGVGVWTVDADGVVSLDPDPAYRGTTAPVDYRFTDSDGSTATATVTVTVTAVAPDARDDAAGTAYDATLTVQVLGNDVAGALLGADLVPASVRLLDPTTGEAVTTVTVPGQGTWTAAPDGTVSFDPALGFAGPAAPITYRVADANGTTDIAVVRVTVALPAAPTASPDTRTTPQDISVTLDPLANDSGAPGVTLDPASVLFTGFAATNGGRTLVVADVGTFSIDAQTGRVTLDPLPAFTGTTPDVAYSVADQFGQRATSVLRVVVTPITPGVEDDTATTPANRAVSITVLANDRAGDPSAPLDPTTVALVGGADAGRTLVVTGEGTWTVEPTTGSIVFTPVTGFAGVTTPVRYRVADENGTIDTALVTVTVGAGPTAVADATTTPQNVTVSLDVAANDTAGAGGTLVRSSVVLANPAATDAGKTLVVPGQGTWRVDPVTGAIQLDPEPGFVGTATRTYAITDSLGSTAVSTVTVTVAALTPVAADDAASTPSATRVEVGVLANDTAGGPSALLDPTSVRFTDPSAADGGRTLVVAGQGTYTVSTQGVVAFVPAAGFAGVATPVSYRVADANGTTTTARLTISVGAGPAALADAASTPQDAPVSVPVLANDTPGAGAQLVPGSVTLTSPDATDEDRVLVVPGVGTWTVAPTTGAITLDPEPGYVGTTTTTYAVRDTDGNTAVATLTVRVDAVVPLAVDDTATTPANQPVGVVVLANDRAGNTAEPLVPGSVVLTSPLATDGGKTLVVPGVGTFRVGPQGAILFTPESGFSGLAGPVAYQVSDDNGTTATAQLTVTVGAAPTARDDDRSTRQDEPVTLDPLANDAPGAGATLVRDSVQVFDPTTGAWTSTVVLPDEGTVTVAADGTLTFDPLPTFTGTTSATYRVADTDGNLAAATITFRVAPVVPRAVDDDAATPLATPVTLDVVANDAAGAASAPLVASSVVLTSPAATAAGRSLVVPGEGSWTVEATTGALTFTPLATFSGRTTAVQYRVLDDNGTPATASARVDVGAAPVARADSAETPQDVPVQLLPLANDSAGTDGAGGTGTLEATSVVLTGAGATNGGRRLVVAGEGTWTVSSTTGAVTFDPLPDFTGTTTAIAYDVTDSYGSTASSTLRVRVTAITPTVTADTASTPASTPVTVDVLANDAPGAASAPLVPGSVVLTSPQATAGGRTLLVPGEGSWSVDPTTGALTFSPEAGFDGLTTPVQYRVSDDNGTSGTAFVQVSVGVAPDAVADVATTPQNVTVTLDPLENDEPGTGATLLLGSVTLTDPGATDADRTLVVAGQGTWSVDPTTGQVSFDPVATFTGQAATTYAVRDSTGNAAVATITVTVGALAPTARPDTGLAAGGLPVTVPVLDNDTAAAPSAPLDPTTVVLTDAAATDGGRTLVVPGQGTWTVNPDTGAIRFVPAGAFTGPTTPVTYRVGDVNGTTATSTVTVIVGERPLARPDLVVVDQGATARVDPLTNDIGGTDGAGGRATLIPSSVLLTDPAATDGGKRLVVADQGTWSVDPTTGAVTFVPVAGFSGDAVVPYSVRGSYGATATSTITVRVTPVAPSVNDDTAASPAGSPVTVAVLANDAPGRPSVPLVPASVVLTDPAATDGGKTLLVPGQGTWRVEPNGSITFTPAAGFAGVTTPPVQYRVSDTNGTTGTGRVSVTVGDAPTATPDTAGTLQGVPVTLDPLGNDQAGSGATLDAGSVRLSTPGATGDGRTLVVAGEGTWTVSPTTGAITFEPEPGFTGQASTTYTVTDSDGSTAAASVVVSVTAVTPTALDDVAGTPAGTPVVVTVLGNDRPGTPAAGLDPASVVLTSPAATNGGARLVVPGEGTWTVLPDGTVRFAPVAGFTGPTSSVTYRVADVNGTTATAQVTVTVGPGPVGRTDAATTTQNVTVAVDVLDNDSPATGATLVPTSVVLTSPAATDAGRTLVVVGVGTWTVLPDGTVRLDPLPGFTGTTSTTYAVSDSAGNTTVATVAVTVTAVQPDAADDAGATPAATPVTVDVLANDTAGAPGVALQPGSVVLTAAGATDAGRTLVVPGEGTWTVAPDGRITFTPLPGFVGLATPVTYRVADANGTTATATVTVSVGAAPTAAPDTATTDQGDPVSLDPLVNDSSDPGTSLDPTSVRLLDPATLTYQRSVTVAGEGTWSVDPATGRVTFTPEAGFTGPASVTYQVADSDGNLAVSTIAVDVTPVVAPVPVSLDDVATTPYGAPVTIDVLANDSAAGPLDASSVRLVDPVTGALVTSLTVPGEGTWTVNPDGTLTFTPLPTFSGPATPVTYSVEDSTGTAATAEVVVTVAGPGTTPDPTPSPTPNPTPTPTGPSSPGTVPGTSTDGTDGTDGPVRVDGTDTTTSTDGTGVSSNDGPRSAPKDGGILPNTGGPALTVLGLGIALLLAGAWVLTRRRRA